MRALYLIPATLFLLAACGSDNGSGIADAGGVPVCPDPTFTAIHDTILSTPRCTACHATATPSFGNLGLGIGKGGVYAGLQAASNNPSAAQSMLLVPGQPNNSFLYVKVSDSTVIGGLMPLGGMLSACEVDAIGQWITDGALNN